LSSRTALVAGATGLVGSHLVRRLLAAETWARVVTVGRRPLESRRRPGQALDHPKLEQRLADFDHLDALDFPTSDDAFCCLGTTIKKAGSEEAFRKVDFDYALAFAEAAHAHGARQFVVVSAMGADAASRIFYNRLKGEMEEAVATVGFEAVQIVRPALLLGDRNVQRPKEKAAAWVMKPLVPLMHGPLKKYRPIEADIVAAAMVAAAQVRTPGVHVYESDALAHVGDTL
jgi:uncharacterized protein YbjT (DUF2867 family)